MPATDGKCMLSLHRRQDTSARKLQAFELRNSRAPAPTNRSVATAHNPSDTDCTSATPPKSASPKLDDGCPLHRCTSARRPRLFVQADPHNCSVRRAATWLLPVRWLAMLNIRTANTMQLHGQRWLNTGHLRRRLRHPRRRHTLDFRLQHQHTIRTQALQDRRRGTREQGCQDSAVSGRLRRRR